VLAENISGTTWTYKVTVAPGSSIAVKALAVYPNADMDTAIPQSWSDMTPEIPGWDLNGGWEGKAFGFRSTGSGYITAEMGTVLVGTATFPLTDPQEPQNQKFLVQVQDGGVAEWRQIGGNGVIPETDPRALFLLGLVPVIAILRPRPKKAVDHYLVS